MIGLFVLQIPSITNREDRLAFEADFKQSFPKGCIFHRDWNAYASAQAPLIFALRHFIKHRAHRLFASIHNEQWASFAVAMDDVDELLNFEDFTPFVVWSESVPDEYLTEAMVAFVDHAPFINDDDAKDRYNYAVTQLNKKFD